VPAIADGGGVYTGRSLQRGELAGATNKIVTLKNKQSSEIRQEKDCEKKF